jgi:N-methylhydantoinase A
MVAVIDANMAAGIRAVTVERGHDPREFLLVVGGGAGPVHAAGIAHELGLRRILVPRSSAIFCAVGLLLSDLRHDFVRSHVAAFEGIEQDRLAEIARALQAEARGALDVEGIHPATAVIMLGCDVRYLGQYHELTVPWLADEVESADLTGVAKRFHEAHDRLYGYALPEAPLELVNVRATAMGLTPKPPLPEMAPGVASEALRGHRPVWIAEERGFVRAPVYDGEGLGSGARLGGPAIVELPTTTVVLGPGWRCETDRHGSFLLERP